MATKKQHDKMFVIVDATRVVTPGIELPVGYQELQPIGQVLILPNPSSQRVLSIVDGPIEDIYRIYHIATGERQYDGTYTFEPEAQRVLNLIRIGMETEDVVRKNIHEVLQAALSDIEELGTSADGTVAAPLDQIDRRFDKLERRLLR